MFDAKADRERFGFDVDAAIEQHFESVACAVADGKNDVIRCNTVAVVEHHTAQLAATVRCGIRFNFNVNDSALKTKFAAKRFNRGAHVLDHFHETKGADVWLADVHNFVGRASLHKFFEHFSTVVLRVFHLRPEFAVGKCARAALAELHI